MEETKASQILQHAWRNGFHIEAPLGLLNDPNGLSYYNGAYYIFFQWNPHGCTHKNKHWGLVKTTDFIRFTKPRLALTPGDAFDQDGCYSGCGVVEDGKLKLFYTGNVKNSRGERESYQCAAVCMEQDSFEKQGVLLPHPPEGYTAHWRDPYVFYEDGDAYMVVGAQTRDLQGAALLYRRSLEAWHCVGALQTQLGAFGYMWECPNLVRMEDARYAFIFSPQGLAQDGLQYQNLYQSGYVIGALDVAAPTLQHGAFRELDQGFDFYAPQVFTDDGRRIMIGWAGMPDRDAEYPTAAFGWMYALTLPRELSYRDGRLYQTPLRELERLRSGRMSDAEHSLMTTHESPALPRAAEIELAVDVPPAGVVALVFTFGEEAIRLSYDRKTGLACIDRSNMRHGGQGTRTFALDIADILYLQIFVDRSIMEIFYARGQETATVAYYPSQEGMRLQLSAPRVRSCRIHRLREIEYV